MLSQEQLQPIKNYISKFMALPDAVWQPHAACLTRLTLKKGEFLLKSGQVCNHVSFVNYGFLRTFTLVNGEDVTINFSIEGNYVTEYCSFLTRQPTNENVIATTDCELIQLSYENMQRLYKEVPAWQEFGRLISKNTVYC
jgi:CRP-like cAMP-binding protein